MSLWRLYVGAVLMLGGLSGFIVDFRNKPRPVLEVSGTHAALVSGLTPTAYDLIHVAGWSLIIAGVLLMIMGLIRYSVAARS
jgi:membrane-bound ClpP family serine protease